MARFVGDLRAARAVWAVLTAVSLLGCAGVDRRGAEPIWTRPSGSMVPADLPADHPLWPVALAVERGECAAVVDQSDRLRVQLLEEVAAVRGALASDAGDSSAAESSSEGGAASTSRADAMREILDEIAYRDPPVLEIGDLGFEYPAWWADSYAFCLAEVGRLGDAAAVYTERLQSDLDLDAMWRLALVLAWDERVPEAVEVLEAWPDGAPRPAGYEAVMSGLERDGRLPEGTQPGRHSLN